MADSGINVMVPLGGLGSRFQKEGYLTRCKPFVPVLGKQMIIYVLDSFTLSEKDTLIVVYNPAYMGIGNFMQEVVGIKYPRCKFVELPGPTRGAAETVLFGLKGIDEELRKKPTLLADGDTFYTSDIVSKFREVCSTHNACFCFHDTQEKPIYSYIKLDSSDEITEVKEKVKISDWANSGCYCFRNGCELAAECEEMIDKNLKQASQDGVGEFYTSGVIAAMLDKKQPFKALKLEVSDIHVLGTPSQVKEFCAAAKTQPRQRFVFDLEGVLVAGVQGEPIARNIETLRRLKKQGHIIIVQSIRSATMEAKTWKLLESHDIPCDDLRMGKTVGEWYIAGPNTVDATLMGLDEQLGFYPTDIPVTKPVKPSKPPTLKKARSTAINKLNPDSKGVTCVVKVIGSPKAVQSNKSGITFYEVACGDETGKVTLSLTEVQKAGVVKDQVVVVRNAAVKMVNGFIRLTVDKWGKLDASSEETVSEVGSKDISAVEYELK
jgi:NDP-sugar pyrophosphorylase family protein